MAVAENLAAVLESLGYGTWGGGTTPGVTIFLDHEPDTPPVCTTLYFPGGPPDALTFDGDANGETPAQVRMRDSDPANLRARIYGLYTLWTPWRTYAAYNLRLKASSKPLLTYPTQDSNQGTLYIASFNVTAIQGS